MGEYTNTIIAYSIFGLFIFTFYLPTIKKQKHSKLSMIYIFIKCLTLWPLAILYAIGEQFAEDMEARKKKASSRKG